MVISQSIWVASYTVAATLTGQAASSLEMGLSDALLMAEAGVSQVSPQLTEQLISDLNPDFKKPTWQMAFNSDDPPSDRPPSKAPLWLGDAFNSMAVMPELSTPLSVDVTYVPRFHLPLPEGVEMPSAFQPIASDHQCMPFPGEEVGLLTRPVLANDKHQASYQVWVGKYPVFELPTEIRADWVAQRLRYQLEEFSLEPMNVRLMQRDGVPTLYLNDQLLVMVHDDLATAYDRSADLLAIAWANNLLIALGQSPMSLVEAQTQLYGLAYTGEVMDGLASWYGPYFHGRITATGETFDQTELTAAHPSLPFGTYLEVINLDNDQSVIVRINDRGPYVGERSLDLSHQAAQCINSEGSGVVNYEAHVLAALPQTPPTSSAALVNDHLIAQAQERLQDNPS